MARTAKRLAQVALSNAVAARLTAGASSTIQITEIYLANTGTVDRIVSIYQGGNAAGNMIMNGIIVPKGGCVVLENKRIVVAASQTLAAKQDVGADIIMTLFGVEETV